MQRLAGYTAENATIRYFQPIQKEPSAPLLPARHSVYRQNTRSSFLLLPAITLRNKSLPPHHAQSDLIVAFFDTRSTLSRKRSFERSFFDGGHPQDPHMALQPCPYAFLWTTSCPYMRLWAMSTRRRKAYRFWFHVPFCRRIRTFNTRAMAKATSSREFADDAWPFVTVITV